METISNTKKLLEIQSNVISQHSHLLLNHKIKEDETKKPEENTCKNMFLIRYGYAFGDNGLIYRIGYG